MPAPRSLAGLHASRRKGASAADVPPQTGLLFASEPATEPAEESAAPARRVWSVRELVAELRGHVERRYADTWIEGEISNCRSAPSGHLYFTLKDGDAQLPVVLFRRQAMLLKFRPEDGMSVLARGSVSVYENRGQLQLIAETLEPRGEGALRLAFEQLKAKLRDEGLFDAERKRPLPAFPTRIGVITSPGGAVLHDIATICRRRHRCLGLLVFPALMQGESSAREVMAGIEYFNSAKAEQVDLILIARGGGSVEDLWGFNDEALARAIAASGLPVVSAIGHETDFTIADFVADLRAPTPSAAAEMITEAQSRVAAELGALERRLERGVRFQGLHARQRLAAIDAGAAFARMRNLVARRQQHLDTLQLALEGATEEQLRRCRERVHAAERRLAAVEVPALLRERRVRWEHAERALARSMEAPLARLAMRQARVAARLGALDPAAVLQRGYALVFREDGRLLRSPAQVAEGDAITLRVAEGSVRARVTGEEGKL